MRNASLAAIVSLALCAGCGSDETAGPVGDSLLDRLPRDPLAAVVISLDDPAAAHETLANLFRLAEIAGGKDPAELDVRRSDESQSLGIVLERDLLPALDGEVALSIDVPPLDLLAGEMMQGSADLVAEATGRVGLIAKTKDPRALRSALHAMFERNGATLADDGDVETARFPLPAAVRDLLPPDIPASEISLHYVLEGDLLAMGFDAGWLREALAPRPAGERLVDGADFRRVFGTLPRPPLSLIYVNLPEIHDRLRSSTIAQLAIGGNPEWERLWAFLNENLGTDTGLGQTTTRVEGRALHTTRGPSWVPGLADLVATGAAVVTPRQLARAERRRQEATMARLRALAAAIDAYALDHGAYPVARRIERLRELLEPRYVEATPIYDGWGNPLRVLGTRSGYTLCSGGRDGGDCSFVDGGGPTTGFDEAIILQNGKLVQWPGRSAAR